METWDNFMERKITIKFNDGSEIHTTLLACLPVGDEIILIYKDPLTNELRDLPFGYAKVIDRESNK